MNFKLRNLRQIIIGEWKTDWEAWKNLKIVESGSQRKNREMKVKLGSQWIIFHSTEAVDEKKLPANSKTSFNRNCSDFVKFYFCYIYYQQ